ncbi:hypothetical protein Pla110_38000 [Polystyrenella longa]|uniref:Uncharacterized protein n=1 Tax=Polystyrenella longa TaxID=2528007 RepID=A0A518CS50_9PLAN|nr:hypothetical protein [Polystyrenella longa]QDU82045.1 hypothetical protein Pla110_38000 [Polystyrenella longa]
MYDSLQFVTQRLFFIILAISFPFSGQLSVQFTLYELAEVETLQERGEIRRTENGTDRNRRSLPPRVARGTSDGFRPDSLTNKRQHPNRIYDGHRLFTGDVAPLRC